MLKRLLVQNVEWRMRNGEGLGCGSTPIPHSTLPIRIELRRRNLVEPLAQLAPQPIGPTRVLRISVAFGKRVEPIESKASCNRVL